MVSAVSAFESSARSARSARPGQQGFTLLELLIVIAVAGIIVAIAVSAGRRARIAGNEASAISSLEAINSAQAIFKAACGNERYAPDLPSLGVPVPSTGQAFLTSDLTTGPEVIKAGYVVRLAGEVIADAPPACNGVQPAGGYQATADPLHLGATGLRYFGTNTSRAIYENGETFTGNMPETGAPRGGREVGTTAAQGTRAK